MLNYSWNRCFWEEIKVFNPGTSVNTLPLQYKKSIPVYVCFKSVDASIYHKEWNIRIQNDMH